MEQMKRVKTRFRLMRRRSYSLEARINLCIRRRIALLFCRAHGLPRNDTTLGKSSRQVYGCLATIPDRRWLRVHLLRLLALAPQA